jgi:Domain of unknown function (DUF4340)
MSARRVVLLLAAGVALIGFALWLSSRRHLERAVNAGDLVLPGLEHSVNSVTTVRLRRGDDTHTTLNREGSGWLVAERGWPADVGKLRKLLLDLGALNVVEEKTRLPANYPALGVEDVSSPKASGTLIEVVSAATRWAIIIGKSSSGKSGYVRPAGLPQSLLAAPLLSVDADPKGWLVRELIELPTRRVREVEERPLSGPAFRAARDKADGNFAVSPRPKGRELSGPGAAEPLAGALTALTLDDVRKGAPPADAPLAHAVFRTFDGLEVEVTGRKDGTHSLVALSARSTQQPAAPEADKLNARSQGWEFEIPDYKYSALFTPLEDLLKPPPPLPLKKHVAPAKKPSPAAAPAPTAPAR